MALARVHFPTYMYVCHRTDMSGEQAAPYPHHMTMIDALNAEGHTAIIAPRGSAKTTLVRGWVEWQLGRASMAGGEWARDFRTLYVSASATQAYRVSNAIRATLLSNEYYRALFPKVKPHKDKFSEHEWKVEGNDGVHANFLAVGVGGPALGFRASEVYLDDIGDQENMSTPYQRAQLVGASTEEGFDGSGWLDQTLMPILVPWGRVIMLCTRWAWDDPAEWAKRRDWKIVTIRALDEEGTSYWPERFPAEKLEKMRRESPKSFARQYQNEVAPGIYPI